MKKSYLTVMVLFLCISAASAAVGPRICMTGGRWDFGRIPQGDSREKIFEIRNSGDADLIIENVKSCCGYTVVSISTWQIKPGKKSAFKVLADASKKALGADEKKIIIKSNDGSTPLLHVPVCSQIYVPYNNKGKERVR